MRQLKITKQVSRPDTPLAETPEPKLTSREYKEKADSLNFESRKKVYSQINKELKNVKRSSNLDKDKKIMKQYDDLAKKKFATDPDMIQSKKYNDLANKKK